MSWSWYNSKGQLKVATRSGAITKQNYRQTAINTTILTTDNIIEVTNTTSSITITLPSASGLTGRVFRIITHEFATTYPTTINTIGGETLNGDNVGMILEQNFATVDLVSNGTGWRII